MGRLPRSTTGRIAVVSPHLDDAVLSCGDLIADNPGALVVTVFAGGPAAWGAPTPWDAAAGFGPGDDVIAGRRAEDRHALDLLGARPAWLPFWDSQYGGTPAAEEITAALGGVLARAAPEVILIPAGLWHSDHRLAHEAAVALMARHSDSSWFAYEDAIYRRYPDARLAERRAWLASRGIAAIALPPGRPASAVKRRSIACYASQLRALAAPGRPGADDAYAPERYWALVPAAGSP